MYSPSVNRKAAHPRAFSLVELVVVVVILGILASIAIPRLSRGASGAGESALVANLNTLRNAIQHYAIEHKNKFPGSTGDGTNAANSAESFVNHLTLYSAINGKVSKTKGGEYIYGPYIFGDIPPLPVGKHSGVNGVLIDTTKVHPDPAPDGTHGWVYNPKSGIIIANDGTQSVSAVKFSEF